MEKKSILLVHTGDAAFVELDKKFLSVYHDVSEINATKPFPLGFLRYWRGIAQSHLLFCWFASWNSFWAIMLSKIFRIPSVLIIGGYDLANLPEIKYGHQRRVLMRPISRLAMRMATHLSCFSNFSKTEAQRNAHIPPSRLDVNYLGIPDVFKLKTDPIKENIVLTVANVNRDNLKRKGLELFVQTAALVPGMKFILVGKWMDDAIDILRGLAGGKVTFTGQISDEQLQVYFQQAKYYVQASRHEGFGMSLAQAMLARCIPIVSDVGSIPEVVGDCGIYIKKCEPEYIAAAIRSVSDNSDIGERARDWILRKFPPEKRIEDLHCLIDSALHHTGQKTACQ